MEPASQEYNAGSPPTLAALDPRSSIPDVELAPLTTRPASLDGLRVSVVQTMPPGSGLETVVTAFMSALSIISPTSLARAVMRSNFMMHDPAEGDAVAADCDLAVVLAGPAATMARLALLFADHLERRGVPTVVAHFPEVAPAIQHELGALGSPLRTTSVPREPNDQYAAAQGVVARLCEPLSAQEQAAGVRVAPRSSPVFFVGSAEGLQDALEREGLGDGFPVGVPTREAVDRMLAGTAHHPDELVTSTFQPERRACTVELVARTAVLAGAKPEHLPVLLAAASVFGDQQFESMTRSVNSFAFAQMVHGPICAEIAMNGSLGGLGPGTRANAVIGRTTNLLIRTVGGARHGVNVTPTQGNAVGYSAAWCESPNSPWDPDTGAWGYSPGDSAVSVLLGGWAHNGNFYYGDLDDVVRALQAFEIPQTGAVVFLSELRARQLADAGWSRTSVSEYLHERATVRLGDFRSCGFWPMCRNQIEGRGPSTAAAWPQDYLTLPDTAVVPGYPPGSIHVVVVGGDVSSLVQVWKWQLHRTVNVDHWR